ncbi:MAG: hypothetical protein K2I96_24875 [Lachnospiraceae bacterium]|nr:hypothetical protein [Lachnospiraceae bacterium]
MFYLVLSSNDNEIGVVNQCTKNDTLKSYGLNWLRTVKALELEARTYDEYENIIEKRIGNHNIGSRQLQSIASDTWQAFINELSGKFVKKN